MVKRRQKSKLVCICGNAVERSVCAIGRTAEFIQNCLIFLLHLKNLSLLLHNLLLQLCRKRLP